jgi:hypothetical protein
MNTLSRKPFFPSEARSDTEQRSWHRAIAAHALASGRMEDPVKIVKQSWPNDDRALMITRGAVTPTTTAGLWTYDPVVAFRFLAPSSAATHLRFAGLDSMGRYGCQVIRKQTSSNFLLKRTVSQNPSGRRLATPFISKRRLMSAIGT